MNKYRGEIEFTSNNKTLILRPTFDAIACIETKLNKGVMYMIDQIETRGVTLNEIYTIIYYGAKAAGETITEPEIHYMIEHAGMSYTTKVCIEFLLEMV